MKLSVNSGSAGPFSDRGVRCNWCGKHIAKNAFGYFEDFIAVSKTWGYGLPIDGETHVFNICYDCYEEFAARCVLPPDVAADAYAVAE